MCDEKCLVSLRKNKLFKGYARNCYLGFMATYFAVAILLSGIVCLTENAPIIMNYLVPIIVAGAVVCVSVISWQLYNKKPYICCEGEIISLDDKKAEIKISDRIVKGTSFESFLTSKKLKGYKTGDKVVVYSSDKKGSRPLFMHSEDLN